MSKAKRLARVERGKQLIITAIIIIIVNLLVLVTIGILYYSGVIDIVDGQIVMTEDDNLEHIEKFKMPEEKNVAKRAEAVVDYFITEDMDDFDKLKTLHDWIVKWTKFDYNELSNSGDKTKSSYSEYGVFITGYAASEGYAKAFKLLCNLIGINSRVVYGQAAGKFNTNHVWNLVELGGRWYAVDVAWNDVEMEKTGSDDIIYDYFLATDDMLLTTHTWKRGEYETCYDERFALKAYKGKTSKSTVGIRRIIEKQYKKGNSLASAIYTGAGMPDITFIDELYPGSKYFLTEIGKYVRLTIKFNR